MTFRAVGFGNYAYIVDEDTGGELFKDQGYTLQQLEEKAASLNAQLAATQSTPINTDNKVSQNNDPEDAGKPTDKSNPDVKAAGNPENATPSATNASTVSNAGTTIAGKSGSSTVKSESQSKSPTVRPNPLGYLASYAYQATLYMITPDALNSFRQSNRKNISNLTASANGGAYIIAQSGGVNNTSTVRAPGFTTDYFIDNIQITSAMGPNDNQSPTVTTSIRFTITEPYGFSFLSRLKLASDTLEQYSKTLNIKNLENSSRQFFILGIRFQGYDKYGKLMTGKETIDGRVLDPAGSGNGLFETFYEILFKKVNFKIDGKATVYNIEAVSLNVDSLSIKNGMIPSAVSIEAATVDEALQGKKGLLTIINQYYKDQKLDITPVYRVQYVGDLDDLKNATLMLPEDVDKWKWAISRGQSDALGEKAVPNPIKKLLSFSNSPSTTIIAAIEKVITQSSFLRNAFKVTPTSDVEPNTVTKNDAEIKPDSVRSLRWFCITTNVKILGYSDKYKDFIYDTTYVISPYETPVVLSTYVKNLPPYYGPVKRYDYWFTGKNTEIISYEQVNNNGYFIVSLDTELTDEAAKQIATRSNFQQPGDKTAGKNARSEAINSVTSNLYDPKSYSSAKMTILGDPDFLVQDSLNFDVGTNTFNKFFAPNGTTINPTGGQVYVEVDFKEGVDYNYKTGTMDINESITFWQYPESIKKLIHGVSYQVKRVTSNFKSGKFTQDLDMFINLLDDENLKVAGAANNQGREAPSATTQNTPGTRQGTGSTNTPGGQVTSTGTGLKPEPMVASSSPPPQPESTQTPDNPGTTQSSTGDDSDGGRE